MSATDERMFSVHMESKQSKRQTSSTISFSDTDEICVVRSDSLDMDTTGFFFKRINEAFRAEACLASNIKGIIQVNLTTRNGPESYWFIDFQMRHASQGLPASTAHAILTVPQHLFPKVAMGKIDLVSAYMDNIITMQGDRSLVRELAKLAIAGEDFHQMAQTGVGWELPRPSLVCCGLNIEKRSIFGYVPAFGKPVMRTGVHSFCFKILRSASNDGAGMCLGIAAVGANGGATQAWGLEPSSGRLWCCADARKWGKKGKKLMVRGQSLQYNANGATVFVQVDMNTKRVAFGVRQSQAKSTALIDAGVTISGEVRPWAMLGWALDSIKLCDYVSGPADLSPKPPSSKAPSLTRAPSAGDVAFELAIAASLDPAQQVVVAEMTDDDAPQAEAPHCSSAYE